MNENKSYKQLQTKAKRDILRRKISVSKSWNKKETEQLIKETSKTLNLSRRGTTALRAAAKTLGKGQRGVLIKHLIATQYAGKKEKVQSKIISQFAEEQSKRGKPLTSKELTKNLISSLNESKGKGTLNKKGHADLYFDKLAKNISKEQRKHKRTLTIDEINKIKIKTALQTKAKLEKEARKQNLKLAQESLSDAWFIDSPTGEGNEEEPTPIPPREQTKGERLEELESLLRSKYY